MLNSSLWLHDICDWFIGCSKTNLQHVSIYLTKNFSSNRKIKTKSGNSNLLLFASTIAKYCTIVGYSAHNCRILNSPFDCMIFPPIDCSQLNLQHVSVYLSERSKNSVLLLLEQLWNCSVSIAVASASLINWTN